jgi:hypothetical protein
MGQYSAKETILKLRECIIPNPRKDEMVNELSHDTTVPFLTFYLIYGTCYEYVELWIYYKKAQRLTRKQIRAI